MVKQAGGQGGKVHLYVFWMQGMCENIDMLLPDKVPKTEVRERIQEQVEGLPTGHWRGQ